MNLLQDHKPVSWPGLPCKIKWNLLGKIKVNSIHHPVAARTVMQLKAAGQPHLNTDRRRRHSHKPLDMVAVPSGCFCLNSWLTQSISKNYCTYVTVCPIGKIQTVSESWEIAQAAKRCYSYSCQKSTNSWTSEVCRVPDDTFYRVPSFRRVCFK